MVLRFLAKWTAGETRSPGARHGPADEEGSSTSVIPQNMEISSNTRLYQALGTGIYGIGFKRQAASDAEECRVMKNVESISALSQAINYSKQSLPGSARLGRG